MTQVTGVPFERFLGLAASLDVDRDDPRGCRVFVNHKIADLLVRAEALAEANSRDVVERIDRPIIKGRQESFHRFEKLDAEVELEPVLERITTWPQLDFGLSEETRDSRPSSPAASAWPVPRTFPLIDSKVKNPTLSRGSAHFGASTPALIVRGHIVTLDGMRPTD